MAAGGAYVGTLLHKPTFSITVSLLKRPPVSTVQTSETGQAYRPSELNDNTLLATLLSKDPIDEALNKVQNGLSAEQVKGVTEATQLSGTSIFYLTYISPIGEEDAVEFTKVWADEINNYTKQLQRADAMSTREILEKEVEELDASLAEINKKLHDFSKSTNYLGADTQVVAALSQLSSIESELAKSRVTLKSQIHEIETLTSALRKQSSREASLRAAQDKLASLRVIYTDENPLVQQQLANIELIEKALEEEQNQAARPLEDYMGTTMGEQFYLDILRLENARAQTAAEVESGESRLTKIQEKISKFPEIVSRYNELQNERNLLITTRSLLGNRLKEARIFSANSPGYWKIFQEPDRRDVVPSSAIKKPMMLGVLGFMFGAGASLVLSIIFTSRSKRRSALECCAATKGPLLVNVPAGSGIEAFDTLWIANLAQRRSDGETILIWTGLTDEEDEARFWQGLALAAQRDGIAPIFVENIDTEAPKVSHDIDELLYWVPPGTGRRYRAFQRLRNLPSESVRPKLKDADYWFALTSNSSQTLADAGRFYELTGPHMPTPDGTVVLNQPAHGILRRGADFVSLLLTKHFSKPPKPAPAKT